jgi:hypothetical protein
MRNRFRGSMILVATAAAVALPSLVVRSTAGQRPAPAYRATRTVDGKPNLDGIWQALNTANWDIQTSSTRSPATRKSNVSCQVCHAPRTCRIPFR